MLEVVDVAIGPQAADDVGAGRRIDGQALGADGNLAIVAHADAGAHAPDKGPPGTGGGTAQNGAFAFARLFASGLGSHAQFAMDFVCVDVGKQCVQQGVGTGDFPDVLGSQECGQAFLPVVMAAFDLALGLGCRGVAQGHAVEVKGGSQLGEALGVVGEEDGVVIDVEGQGQSVLLEDAGEKVHVGQEGFGGVEAGTKVVAGGVVEEVEQDLLVLGVGKEAVGCGVVLPDGAFGAGLPAFDGLGDRFVTGVGCEVVCDGPAADGGAVGLEGEAAEQFAGASAVGGWRFGGEKFFEQGAGFVGPAGMVIAAGESGRPGAGLSSSAGAEVIRVEFVESGTRQPEFAGGGACGEFAAAMSGEDVTDEGGGEAFDQL